MKCSASYAWAATGGLAFLAVIVIPLGNYYFFSDVNIHIEKYYTIETIPKEDIKVIDNSILDGYPSIKDGFQREELSSQKCVGSSQESCSFTIDPTIVQFKVPEIDAISQTFHFRDCSSPALGSQRCSIVQYGQNYYGLTAAIPTDKLLASIFYGGVATVIGTIAIAIVWVKIGNSSVRIQSEKS